MTLDCYIPSTRARRVSHDCITINLSGAGLALRSSGHCRDYLATFAHHAVSSGRCVGFQQVITRTGGKTAQPPESWPIHPGLARPRRNPSGRQGTFHRHDGGHGRLLV
jgi:hypothetical protein